MIAAATPALPPRSLLTAPAAAAAGGAMEGALLQEPWLKARERVRTEIFADSDDISRVVAAEIAALIRQRQAEGARLTAGPRGRAGMLRSIGGCGVPAKAGAMHSNRAVCLATALPAGRQCVLGLATGSTPMHVYRELVRLHRWVKRSRCGRLGRPARRAGQHAGLGQNRKEVRCELVHPTAGSLHRRPQLYACFAALLLPVAPPREEGLSFAGVQTFNLDEYHPMQPDALQAGQVTTYC